jgi:hypothetical protein
MGALLTMPAWANSWHFQTVTLDTPILNSTQDDLLTDIVSTIIPEGDKPGAKVVGVHIFIQKLVADCYEPQAQEDFKAGLDAVEKTAQQTYKQRFAALSPAQKEEILRGGLIATDEKEKTFFSLIKNLTIQGYLSSEYVLVNHYKYDMAPGHYYGCVPI